MLLRALIVRLNGSLDLRVDVICVNARDRAATTTAGFEDAWESKCRVSELRCVLDSNSSVAGVRQFPAQIA